MQEYDRFRNSKVCQWIQKINHQYEYPCYLKIRHVNEDNYSKYRNAKAKRTPSNRTSIPMHHNCRNMNYNSTVMRFPVLDERVYWDVIYPDYSPIEFTIERILHNPKADPIDPLKIQHFNEIDETINRISFTGRYHVDSINNRPQNPMGRTGITGRGRLYYWGPNHAGDPVVTRWLRDDNEQKVYRQDQFDKQLKPVLEFVAIQRRDTKQWALPGGMVDASENVSETVKREFEEEAMSSNVDKSLIEKLFSQGHRLFASYCDDPRNTDNAWIETVAIQYHDETGELTKDLKLNAGDDAEKVVWCSIDHRLDLYASHKHIIELVVNRMNAFWQ